jgi:AcrR family transcriptional regulator
MSSSAPAAAATPERLLEAAGQLFAERGYRGATLREIADRAGTNLAAANYHFGSKERLYLEVVRRNFDVLERRLVEQGAVAEDEDLAGRSRDELAARLRAGVGTMLATLLVDNPVHAALMQRELLDPSDALPVIVERWVEPLCRAMDRLLAHLAPELSADAVERCTRSVVGQVFFYLTHRPALLLLLRRRAYAASMVDQVADHVTAFTLAGLEGLCRSASPAPAPREVPS